MDLDDLDTPQAALLRSVLGAVARAIRAMGYYDASHPVFASTRKEAHEALARAFELEDVVTLGCGGHHLVVDRDGLTLGDPPAKMIAERMFQRSLVAIRIDRQVDEESLAALMRVLAESEDRIREAGGVAHWLDRASTRGVRVLEVDFAALFSSSSADLAPLVDGDPVAQLALEAILRFGSGDEVGDALQVRFEELGSVESLGAFLDDLLDSSEAGAVLDGDGTGGAFGLITSDDLADYAAKAYLQSHRAITRQSDLGASADLLAGALVRLTPDARFALLRRLAGSDEPVAQEHEAAVAELAGRLEDHTIVEAMAAALMRDDGDSEAVRAIGNVLRRIRPVEAERQRLLHSIDGTLDQRGKRIDGVLWQQMQASAFDDRTLGMLEMNVDAAKSDLSRYATARQRGQLSDVVGQDILHTRGDAVEEHWAVNALIQLLREPGPVSDTFLSRCSELLDRLDEQGAQTECLALLEALMLRADQHHSEQLESMVRALLADDRGRGWSMRLVERRAGKTRMMAELVFSALEAVQDRAAQEHLIERLGSFDAAVLFRFGSERITSVDPLRVQHLLRAALRCSTPTAVKLARIALKGGSVRSKEVALKTLVESPERDVVALLAHAAGWKGERYALQLFGAAESDDRRFLHKLRLAAIGALGLTHAALAVRPLVELLTDTQLIESKEHEELRLGAAQALLTNGTPRALGALDELQSHKKRAVRDLCTRVLNGRGS